MKRMINKALSGDCILEIPDNYVKIETHCHTYPSSLCSQLSPKELVDLHLAKGYAAILLTNHYQKAHFNQFGTDKNSILSGYLKDYELTLKSAKGTDLKVFLGAEVNFLNTEKMKRDDGVENIVHGEMLLFGVSERFLRDTFDLTDLTQKKLFDLCNRENILCYQTHPYRTEHFCKPLDPRYMHGCEVFNPHIQPRTEKCLDFALKNKLLMSGGSDVHSADGVGNSCMYVPKDICNQFELRDYLKKGESLIGNTSGLYICNGKLV